MRSRQFFILLFLGFVFLTYAGSLSGDIMGGDVGDLVTAAVVGGVAHPPGYPLFTLMGFLFSKLPIPFSPAYKIGLISVLSSIGALFFYIKISLRLSKSFFISLLSASTLAFSYLFWFYSEIAEVFALNNFFAVLLFYLAIEYYYTHKKRYVFLLFFFAALSLTHHHTIILLFPSLALLIGRQVKNTFSKKTIVLLCIAVLLGILPYVYVPLSAISKPLINWNNAINLENFLNLVLRKGYGTFQAGQFPSLPPVGRFFVLREYMQKILDSFSLPVAIFITVGAWNMWKRDKIIFFAFTSAVVLTGPLFNLYAGFHIVNSFLMATAERFYVLSIPLLAFFLPVGFGAVKNFLASVFSKKLFVSLIVSEFLLIPLLLFISHYPKTKLSSYHLGNTYAFDILKPLEKKAVVFLSGDTTLFNSWYAHYVLGVRPDVEIVNPPGVGNDYFSQRAKDEYVKIHKKLPAKGLVSDEIIMQTFLKRPLYSLVPFKLSRDDVVWMPIGFTYKLIKKRDIPKEETYASLIEKYIRSLNIPDKNTKNLSEKNLMGATIRTFYSNAFLNIADFVYSQYSNKLLAIAYYSKSLEIDDTNSRSYAGLGVSEFEALQDCVSSQNHLEKAIIYGPAAKLHYVYLFIVFKECRKDVATISKLQLQYTKIFGNIIEEDMDTIIQEKEKNKM